MRVRTVTTFRTLFLVVWFWMCRSTEWAVADGISNLKVAVVFFKENYRCFQGFQHLIVFQIIETAGRFFLFIRMCWNNSFGSLCQLFSSQYHRLLGYSIWITNAFFSLQINSFDPPPSFSLSCFLCQCQCIYIQDAEIWFLMLYRISSRDTGKTMVDASLGEIMTTCEKITWLLAEGEKWLKPEYRCSVKYSSNSKCIFRIFIGNYLLPVLLLIWCIIYITSCGN